MTDGPDKYKKKPDRPNPEIQRQRDVRRMIIKKSIKYFFLGVVPVTIGLIYIWSNAFLTTPWRETKCEATWNGWLLVNVERWNIFGKQKEQLQFSFQGAAFGGFQIFPLGGIRWGQENLVTFSRARSEQFGRLGFGKELNNTAAPTYITEQCWQDLISIKAKIRDKFRTYNPKYSDAGFEFKSIVIPD